MWEGVCGLSIPTVSSAYPWARPAQAITGASSMDSVWVSASHLQAVQESGVISRSARRSAPHVQRWDADMGPGVSHPPESLAFTQQTLTGVCTFHMQGRHCLFTTKMSQELFSSLHAGMKLARESLRLPGSSVSHDPAVAYCSIHASSAPNPEV